MKIVSLLLVLTLLVLPVDSFAGCPDFHIGNGPGPQGSCSENYYTFDLTNCPYIQGATTTTMSCFSWSGYSLNTAYSFTDYHMTVPSGHSSSCKDVEIFVDFNSPSSSEDDGIYAQVWVWRGSDGSLAYSNRFLSHTGTDGSMSCVMVHNGAFTANAGDTIQVQIWGTNVHSATIKTTSPIIWD